MPRRWSPGWHRLQAAADCAQRAPGRAALVTADVIGAIDGAARGLGGGLCEAFPEPGSRFQEARELQRLSGGVPPPGKGLLPTGPSAFWFRCQGRWTWQDLGLHRTWATNRHPVRTIASNESSGLTTSGCALR